MRTIPIKKRCTWKGGGQHNEYWPGALHSKDPNTRSTSGHGPYVSNYLDGSAILFFYIRQSSKMNSLPLNTNPTPRDSRQIAPNCQDSPQTNIHEQLELLAETLRSSKVEGSGKRLPSNSNARACVRCLSNQVPDSERYYHRGSSASFI